MQVRQISLQERWRRIERGEASDPDFIPSTIKSLAQIPICVFLNAFPGELVRLGEILKITKEEEQVITYEEVAVRIDKIRKQFSRTGSCNFHILENAYEAVIILQLPFRKFQLAKENKGKINHQEKKEKPEEKEEPSFKEVEKMTLELRLRKAGALQPNFLMVFCITIEQYMTGLIQFMEHADHKKELQRLQHKLEQIICKWYMPDDVDEELDIKRMLLAEMPYATDRMPAENGISLMCELLVEPFVWMKQQTKEEHVHDTQYTNS